MQGTLLRSVGSDLHTALHVTNDLKTLAENAKVDIQPNEAAEQLVALGVFKPSGKPQPAPEPENVKAVAKEPAIASGK